MGYELVDVEFKKGKTSVLTVYIYKNEGINIDDCSTMSRAIEKELDELDIIEDAYNLEVSSPGLDRPLKTEADYKRNLGKLLEVKLYAPIEGEKMYQGILKDYDKENVYILVEENLIKLPIKSISLMRQCILF